MSMKLVVVLFLLCLFSANAFLKSSGRIWSPHVLQATALDIKGKNIEITEALREKVESKIGGVLAKVGDNAMSTSVILRVEKNDPKGSENDPKRSENDAKRSDRASQDDAGRSAARPETTP